MQGITKSGGRHGLGFVEECEDRAAGRTKIILDIRHLLDPSIVNIHGYRKSKLFSLIVFGAVVAL